MDLAERASRMAALRHREREEDIVHWISKVLHLSTPRTFSPAPGHNVGSCIHSKVLNRLTIDASHPLMLLLDYDGTDCCCLSFGSRRRLSFSCLFVMIRIHQKCRHALTAGVQTSRRHLVHTHANMFATLVEYAQCYRRHCVRPQPERVGGAPRRTSIHRVWKSWTRNHVSVTRCSAV
jgi:hypothetical protein